MYLKSNIKRIRLPLFFVLVIFSLLIGFRVEAFPPDSVLITASPADSGMPTSIRVTTERFVSSMAIWDAEIDFGDGSPIEFGTCTPSGADISCDIDFSHIYSLDGSYDIFVEVCHGLGGVDCLTSTLTINIGNIVGGNCTPCDGICGAGCTVAQDPDCGCVDGDACCGLGCDINNDKDCLGGLNKYDNPILANNITEFIWQALYFVFGLVMWLSLLFILIGAYVLITSGGNMTKTKLGKNIIIFTLIGFTIASLSRGVMAIVFKVLTD